MLPKAICVILTCGLHQRMDKHLEQDPFIPIGYNSEKFEVTRT